MHTIIIGVAVDANSSSEGESKGRPGTLKVLFLSVEADGTKDVGTRPSA